MTAIFIGTWLGLGILQIVYHFESPAVAAATALPIFAMAIFLRPGRPRRMFLAAMLSLPYFVHGAMAWTVQSDPVPAALEVLICTLLYILLIVDGAHRRRRS